MIHVGLNVRRKKSKKFFNRVRVTIVHQPAQIVEGRVADLKL